MDLLQKLATDYQADCIIDLVWQGCLTYEVESYFVKQLAEIDASALFENCDGLFTVGFCTNRAACRALLETAKQK